MLTITEQIRIRNQLLVIKYTMLLIIRFEIFYSPWNKKAKYILDVRCTSSEAYHRP